MHEEEGFCKVRSSSPRTLMMAQTKVPMIRSPVHTESGFPSPQKLDKHLTPLPLSLHICSYFSANTVTLTVLRDHHCLDCVVWHMLFACFCSIILKNNKHQTTNTQIGSFWETWMKELPLLGIKSCNKTVNVGQRKSASLWGVRLEFLLPFRF